MRLRRGKRGRDAIIARLDAVVLEQQRITDELDQALQDQRDAAIDLDKAVNELRAQYPNAE